jgi:hypothetical protein
MLRAYVKVMNVLNCLLLLVFAVILLHLPYEHADYEGIFHYLTLPGRAGAHLIRQYMTVEEQVRSVSIGITLQTVRDAAALGIAFAEIVWIGAAASLLRTKKTREIRYRNEQGDTVIAAGTVEEFLERALLDRSDVTSAQVEVVVDPRSRHPQQVRAVVSLAEAGNIVDTSNSLRDDVRAVMTRLIPVSEKIPVHIRPRVVSVKSTRPSPTPSAQPEAGPSTAPINRPEYPIE